MGKNRVSDVVEKDIKLGLFSLFRYATCTDILLNIASAFFGFGAGILIPAAYIIFGNLTDTFVDFGFYGNCQNSELQCGDFDPNNVTSVICWTQKFENCFRTNDTVSELIEILDKLGSLDLLEELTVYAINFSYFAIAAWAGSWISTTFQMWTAANQAEVIKIEYYKALLRQDVGFYDENEAAVLSQKVTEDVKKIQDALGEKFSTTVKCLGTFLGGISLGLVYNWKFGLVLLSLMPVIALSGILLFSTETKTDAVKKKSYSFAHGIAEEVFTGIRTVTAFNKQEESCQRYFQKLLHSKRIGIKYAPLKGFGLGALPLVLYGVFALGFWYGGKLIIEEDWNVGEMMTCLLAIFIGTFSLALIGNNLDYFTSGVTSAQSVFGIIDRKPEIDKFDNGGKKFSDFKPKIEFEKVNFHYPTRPEEQVLKKFSLKVNPGETVALVGGSGSGKSTIIKLLQRYYEYEGGCIKTSGEDIRAINLSFLRQQIGVVNQEPVLFDMSVYENIRMGNLNASKEDIYNAAKTANAYDFISKLPKGFDSDCGQGGSLLSGGQKQRVCIARALVKNPKILLLDEATSALDTQSEKIVQKALDEASKKRTTIVVAHRLATIKNADWIVAMQNGETVETGTYLDLMKKDGYFAGLVKLSGGGTETENNEDEKAGTKEFELERVKLTDQSDRAETSFPMEEINASFTMLFRMNLPEIGYIILGCFSALINGSVEPLFAISLSDYIGAFSKYEYGSEELDNEILAWSMLSLGIGVVLLIFLTIEYAALGKAGEELTLRLRDRAFRSMIDQDMSYFDDPDNPVGVLTNRLASDASNIQSATGTRVANVLKNFMTLFVSLAIGFAFCWQVALMSLLFLPIIGIANMLAIRQLSGTGADDTKAALEACQNQVSESIRHIKTVTSMGCETHFQNRFNEGVRIPTIKQQRTSIMIGSVMGMTDATLFFSYALNFWFGAWLIDKELLSLADFDAIFKSIIAVIFGAIVLGQNASAMPNYAEAKRSANKLFELFHLESKIPVFNAEGIKPKSCRGELTFHKANFAYPSRENIKVLRSMNLKIKQGQTIAIVGQSGQGKSTMIQLIERFYDLNGGSVLLDDRNIKDLNVNWLRDQIGLVSQEPILFNLSIKENIIYGAKKGDDVSQKEIERCAKLANAHDFIIALESGYDTLAGTSGSQLSGGQKQRIAIARTLIRNPSLLLLDEATSALDNESEKIVQEALDRARIDRTCIIVAHRLSTIKSADLICVLHEGKMVEIGKHEELLEQKGAYYDLVKQQM